jgi:hypothetical protein
MKNLRCLPTLLLAMAIPAHAQSQDYPTSERVAFVLECMREHPGPEFEMLQKCSCALDRLAQALSYESFVEGLTLAKAVTIAGERGGVLRNNDGAQAGARGFRSLYKEARRQCLFQP